MVDQPRKRICRLSFRYRAVNPPGRSERVAELDDTPGSRKAPALVPLKVIGRLHFGKYQIVIHLS